MVFAAGYACRTASGLEALKLLNSGKEFAFVLSGRAALVETCLLECMKGAYDYILKPFEREQLLALVHRTLEYRRLKLENRALQAKLAKLSKKNSLVIQRSNK